VPPGLIHLRNGCKIDLDGARREKVCVDGFGGCYGPSNYARRSSPVQGYAKRHYTHDEVDRSLRSSVSILCSRTTRPREFASRVTDTAADTSAKRQVLTVC
jgi:hypothetical protein